jgi:hypothetical protein
MRSLTKLAHIGALTLSLSCAACEQSISSNDYDRLGRIMTESLGGTKVQVSEKQSSVGTSSDMQKTYMNMSKAEVESKVIDIKKEAKKEEPKPLEQIIEGRPKSAEFVFAKYIDMFSIYLNVDGKDVFVNCEIDSDNPKYAVKLGSNAKNIIDYIISENKQRSEPERIKLSGNYSSSNNFTCKSMTARNFMFQFNEGDNHENK